MGWRGVTIRLAKTQQIDMTTYSSIPDPPEKFDGTCERYWNVYCEALLERGELKDAYLSTVEALCFAERQRLQLEDDIEDLGLYNTYTQDNGSEIVQSNGLEKMYKNTVKRLRDLKRDLKLNPVKEPKAGKGEKDDNVFPMKAKGF